MSTETTKRFLDAIWDIIDYYSKEYDISNAEVVGTLQIVVIDIVNQSRDIPEGDDDED